MMELAVSCKDEGNVLFRAQDFEAALEKYSEGIRAYSPQDEKKDTLAVLYQNRAAVHDLLGNVAACLEDCNAALSINDRYIKALTRRSKALEKRGDFLGALKDITVSSILERMSNTETFTRAQKILLNLSSDRADVFLAIREPVMPPPGFVKSFFALFSRDPLVNRVPLKKGTEDPEMCGASGEGAHPSPSPGDALMDEAKASYDAGKYPEVLALLNKLLSDPSFASPSRVRGEALVSRGILAMLRGDPGQALSDLKEMLDMEGGDTDLRVNALIKRATVHLFNDDLEQSRGSLDQAVEEGSDNPDALLHRGQLCVFQEKYEEAMADFDAARVRGGAEESVVELQKTFAVVRQKMALGAGPMKEAVEQLVATCSKYPDKPDALVLCAQSLSVQGQREKAAELFRKALVLDPLNVAVEVHLILLEGGVDGSSGFPGILGANPVPSIAKLEALSEREPGCQLVYESLGSLYLRVGSVEKASSSFDQALRVAHNQKEVRKLVMLKTVTEVQLYIMQKYSDLANLPLHFLQNPMMGC